MGAWPEGRCHSELLMKTLSQESTEACVSTPAHLVGGFSLRHFQLGMEDISKRSGVNMRKPIFLCTQVNLISLPFCWLVLFPNYFSSKPWKNGIELFDLFKNSWKGN